MSRFLLAAAALTAAVSSARAAAPDAPKAAPGLVAKGDVPVAVVGGTGPFPKFRPQVIDPDVGVGYALAVTDIDADGKPDIVVVTEGPDRVVWYRNPDWTRHVIVEKAPRLPVCVQPLDVDGDGKPELILGADWQPSNTAGGGTVWLLSRGIEGDPTKPWKFIKIDEEPSMHRMRLLKVDGKDELVCSSLQGRGTKGPDWAGAGAAQFILKRPADPFKDKWTREVITTDIHVVHNLWPVDFDGTGRPQLLIAGFEGVFHLARAEAGKWTSTRVAEGNQLTKPNRGSSEIKIGRLPGSTGMKLEPQGRYLATTEPWHGHQAVVYTKPEKAGDLWSRQVLVENHKGGHAVWAADLTGTGVDTLIVGFRGVPEGKKEECVVYLFHASDATGTKWEKLVLDAGGLGSEDITVADLDGDGKPEIIGVGRSTKNVKVYWNLGR